MNGCLSGKYAGEIKDWDRVGEFYSSLVRWVAGQTGPLPDNMMLTQELGDPFRRDAFRQAKRLLQKYRKHSAKEFR